MIICGILTDFALKQKRRKKAKTNKKVKKQFFYLLSMVKSKTLDDLFKWYKYMLNKQSMYYLTFQVKFKFLFPKLFSFIKIVQFPNFAALKWFCSFVIVNVAAIDKNKCVIGKGQI